MANGIGRNGISVFADNPQTAKISQGLHRVYGGTMPPEQIAELVDHVGTTTEGPMSEEEIQRNALVTACLLYRSVGRSNKAPNDAHGKVVATEGLPRMAQKRTDGSITVEPLSRFLGVMRKSEVSLQRLTQTMFEQGGRIAGIMRQSDPDFYVSLNLTGRMLNEGESLQRTLHQTLRQNSLDPSSLHLELVEFDKLSELTDIGRQTLIEIGGTIDIGLDDWPLQNSHHNLAEAQRLNVPIRVVKTCGEVTKSASMANERYAMLVISHQPSAHIRSSPKATNAIY